MRALEQAAERLTDEAVELGRERTVSARELSKMQEEVGPFVTVLGVLGGFLPCDPLQIPEIPLTGLNRPRAELDDALRLRTGRHGR